MKLPNGYGTVYKLNDSPRRRPWIIRKNGKTIGYASTKKEAMEILSEYNTQPWDVKKKKLTFADVFEKMIEAYSSRVSSETIRGYKSRYKTHCQSLKDIPYSEIRTFHFTSILDNMKTSNATKNNLRNFFRTMDRYAYEFDIIQKQYSEFIPFYFENKVKERKPFTEEEIELLWNSLDIEDVDLVLIHIYLGLRPGELVKLKLDNIYFEDRYLRAGSKTKAGINRIVPIHKKIAPLLKKRMKLSNRETLLNFTDKTYRIRFKKVMQKLEMDHIPHECRHTLATRLNNVGANPTNVHRIIGHKDSVTTERIYTHKTISQLIETIDMLN